MKDPENRKRTPNFNGPRVSNILAKKYDLGTGDYTVRSKSHQVPLGNQKCGPQVKSVKSTSGTESPGVKTNIYVYI